MVEENKPIAYPFKRLLYSRKVLMGILVFIMSIFEYLGLPTEIAQTFYAMVLVIIISWTAKDAAANLANGKK